MEPSESHFVVVGLGNPGAKYEKTRHNIGSMVATLLVRLLGWSLKEDKKFHALVAKGIVKGKNLHVVLPQTYMNESGRAIGAYLSFYKLKPESLLVICDDVELPFGQLRLRSKGSSGGHNGLKSIEAYIGTREYLRLKMGIGKELGAATLADFVLGHFRPEECTQLESFVRLGADVTTSLISEPIAAVMNKVNRCNPPAACETSTDSPNRPLPA